MVLPVYISVEYLGVGLYTAWIFVTLYVCLLAIIFRWRYHQGKWKKTRVIEVHSPPIPPPQAAVPGVENL
ncbi:MAG: hypothetical protein QME81_18235 [bacterium]|nr:hypothetical protein [bacterium]